MEKIARSVASLVYPKLCRWKYSLKNSFCAHLGPGINRSRREFRVLVCSLKRRRIYLRVWATEVPWNSASFSQNSASRARLQEEYGLAN